MKRKFLLPILSVCMVAALVSVGFAAWLITGNDTTDAQGSFVTYDVSNNYFTVTATTAAEADKTITFGKPVDTDAAEEGYQAPSTTYDWLSMEDVDEENLTVTFTITITPEVAFDTSVGRDVAKLLNGASVQVTLNGLAANGTSTTAEKYAAAVENGVIDYPTLSCGSGNTNKATDMTAGAVIKLAAGDFTVAANGINATATVTVTFAWGTNGNPYTYYNGLENNSTNRTAATNALNLVNALNGANYYLHLAVVAPAQP